MQENDNAPRQKDAPSQHTGPIHSALSESIAKDLDTLEHTLSDDIANLTKLRKLAQRLKSAWAASDGSVRGALKDQSISLLRSKYPKSGDLLERLATDANRQTTARASAMENVIRSFCAEANQPCEGRYPRLTIAHFIEVSVDTTAGRTKVGATSVQSCDWYKVRPVIEREISRVWGRPFNAATFRDRLLVTYDKIDTKTHSPTGDVRLLDIFQEMRAEMARDNPGAKTGGRLHAYYRDEFSADLSKLWKAQVSGELPGSQLEFSSIRRAEEGFSVILPNGGITTYGFVKRRR